MVGKSFKAILPVLKTITADMISFTVKTLNAFFYCLLLFSYAGAGVVGQRSIVGEGDVFLLPLLIQRAAASLPQDALSETTSRVTAHATNGRVNLPEFRVKAISSKGERFRQQ